MTCVGKVEHGPPGGVWVWLRDLEEGLLVTGCIRIGQSELVYWCMDTGVGDGPLEIARGFTTHCLALMPIRVTTFGGRSTAGSARAGGRDHLGDAEITLWGRGKEVRLLVEVGVNVRVERVVRLTIRRHDERRKVIGNGRMVG